MIILRSLPSLIESNSLGDISDFPHDFDVRSIGTFDIDSGELVAHPCEVICLVCDHLI